MITAMRTALVSLVICLQLSGCAATSETSPESGKVVRPHKGDPSKQGGSPTVRKEYEVPEDHPSTTDDESNDQPLGHMGTITLNVAGPSGHDYTLDADVEDGRLERLYFPKGGWVDFDDCELDENLSGECEDESGRTWIISGEG